MRTYRKNIRREIKNSLPRFFAIFAIAALAVGFLAGLFACEPDMYESVDAYFDSEQLHDIRLISTLGFTDEDIAQIAGTDRVEQVMPAYTGDYMAKTTGDQEVAVRLHSMPHSAADSENWLNRFTLTEGRMPQADDECVVETANVYSGFALQLGDTIIVEDSDDNLAVKTLTVVGIGDSARYFSVEKESATIGSGYINLFLYVNEGVFDMEVYPEVYLTVAGAMEENTFSDGYWALVDPVTDALDEMAEERATLRTEEIKSDARAELADGWAEYEENRQKADEEFADAWQELENAKAELDDGRAKLEDGKAEYADGVAAYEQAVKDYDAEIAKAQKELDDAQKQIEENEKTLSDTRLTLADSKEQLDAQQTELDTQKLILQQHQTELKQKLAEWQAQKDAFDALPAAYQTEDARAQLEAAKQQLDASQAVLTASQTELDGYYAAWEEGYKQYQSGKAQYDAGAAALKEAKAQYQSGVKQLDTAKADGRKQLADAKAELDDAAAEIAENEQKLADGEAEYADGLATYEREKADAEKELADAKAELLDAELDVAKIEDCEWYVLDRDSCVSYVSYDSNVQKVAAIAKVFPLFFFLVAALVIVNTMTRMVDEQRIQIGTLKSLGYGSGAIISKYMIYAGIAVIGGCICGLSIGLVLFPSVIYNAYNMLYALPKLHTPIRWGISLIASAAAIVCAFAATYSACRSTLSEKPANLLLPKTPKAGKRILLERVTFIWKRMKFTHKVTARNLFRYKKRFFMTVIGIAGCTALLLTGFGLRDSISDIVHLQFGEVYRQDFTVTVEDAEDAASGSELISYLEGNEQIAAYYRNSQQSGKLLTEDGEADTTILVPEDMAQMSAYLTLRDRKTHEAVTLDDSGVVLSEKFASTHDIAVGDTITLKNSDEDKAQFTVTGICENYIYSYVYMSPGRYAEAFGEPPAYTTVFGMMQPDAAYDSEELCADMLTCDGVRSAVYIATSRKTFEDMLSKIDYIVMVLIFSAGALAFVVLYNLTNINIAERIKELATIKVLGFKDHEVTAYIYRETAVLTVVGIIFGLFAGIFLHQFVVRTAEVDIVMFGRTIKPLSYLFAAVVTMLFSLFVNLLMGHKMKKISMVESMKANE